MNPRALAAWMVGTVILMGTPPASGPARAEEPASPAYLDFVRAQARKLASVRGSVKPDAVLSEKLFKALGAMDVDPDAPPPLAKVVRTHNRAGYRVESLLIPTLPGVTMTALAYVPDRPGRRPAILAVHGHWKGAKLDPVVQARCIGAAKLGFFVLAVDALGAGERGIDRPLGEYHGGMTAATLLPVGLPLAGLQVAENFRAVAYLRSRPEVDPDRIGITGASGGGNQTMYMAACDDRLRAAVPVCSVGSYPAYLGAACCLCEVVPGALRFADEPDVLGLVAPRALLVESASRDAPQFSASVAAATVDAVRPVYQRLGKPDAVRHTVFDSGHDYSKPMREAMYGWMNLHLAGVGTGEPIPEPEVATEDPETLRVFPGDTRPADWATIPRIAAERGRALLARNGDFAGPAERDLTRRVDLEVLAGVLGGVRRGQDKADQPAPPGVIRVEPEPGIRLEARFDAGSDAKAPVAILLDLDGAAKAREQPIAAEILRAGWGLVTLDLRATGALAVPNDRVGLAPDHNSAEWGLWIGRPLLGQWVTDVVKAVDALGRPEVAVVGVGPAGVVALSAAALDPRITRVAAVGSLASFVADQPYRNQRLGILAPGIVREVGDVADLAALVAPRRVVIAGAVDAGGTPLTLDTIRTAYRPAAHVAKLLGAADSLQLRPDTDAAATVAALR